MKKTKISFFEIDEKWRVDMMKRELPSTKYQLKFTESKLSESNASKHKDADILSIFIHSKIDEKLLTKFPRLRYIVTNTTGYDHIDLEVCNKRGVKVSNVPHYGENTVAEHTFALILGLSRKLVPAVNRTKEGKFTLEGLRGFDLKGKTIGVVGTGNIGRHVIRIAHGFEMKILAFDLKQDKSLENHYPLKYVTLENLLKNSDVVTLHAPYNVHTHHMINGKNIKLLKPTSLLINTARGSLIETEALLAALQKNKLGGAGLDVLEEEGVIAGEDSLISKNIERKELATVLAGHKLMSLDNVIVTPHNAFNSQEAIMRILTTTVENIKAWQAGKPINLVK